MSRKSPINGAELPKGKPFQQGEQQREIARKGGLASAASKAKRKSMCEDLLLLLSQKTNDGTHTVQESISMALIKAAANGNTKAYELIRDTIGEKPVENVVVRQPDMTELNALTNELKAKYGLQTDGETAD